jgi:hypothetical protein
MSVSLSDSLPLPPRVMPHCCAGPVTRRSAQCRRASRDGSFSTLANGAPEHRCLERSNRSTVLSLAPLILPTSAHNSLLQFL